MDRQAAFKYSATLLVCCLVVTFGLGFAGTVTVAAQQSLDVTVDVPQEATAGEQTTLSASVSVPNLPLNYESDLTVTFYSDGQQIGSETVTVSDGETATVDLSHTFENTGDKEVRVEAGTTLGGQEYSGSDTTTLSITGPTTVEGAAFAVPESLEDEVADYRENVPQELDPYAFVLATEDELYLVFTQQEPTKGVAFVEGPVLDRELTTENLTYGVITATNISFETTGTLVSVPEVVNNSAQYRLELVRINAHYRRASTLTDPDESEDFTLSTTSGVLIENPKTAVSFFKNVGSNARTLSRNTSVNQIRTILNSPSGPHLHTFSFETKFWADAKATVDGIVLSPEDAARRFINEYDQAGIAYAEDGEPILYVVKEDFNPRQMDNVTSIKSQADALDGEVVEIEVRLFQERISVQETLEHNTGCGEDLLEIQTSQGSACVNVVQDELLHAGIAWNSIPQSREDALLVMGVSSHHQDTPTKFNDSRYRIVGEVVSTSRLNESLPDGSTLLIYNMTRTGEIDYEAVAKEMKALIETRTGELANRLRQQIGNEETEIEIRRTSQTLHSPLPDSPTRVSFPDSDWWPVSVQEVSINVSAQVQNERVSVTEVASLPSGIDQPPAQSIGILNISSSIADTDIGTVSIRLRISTVAIPDDADVTVYRYSDGEWHALDTTIVDRRDSVVIVEAESSGFSYFSVATQNMTTEPTPADRFDTNGNGRIDFGEVINAIDALNNRDEIGGQPVTFQDVINLIDAFNEQRSS